MQIDSVEHQTSSTVNEYIDYQYKSLKSTKKREKWSKLIVAKKIN